jgi:hypothetical protein
MAKSFFIISKVIVNEVKIESATIVTAKILIFGGVERRWWLNVMQ